MKKLIAIFLLAVLAAGLFAQDFRGKRIAVPEPTFRFGGEAEGWIPIFAQCIVTSNFQNYSGLTIIDKQNLKKAMDELRFSESDLFSESGQLEVGKFVAANYIVAISIIRKGRNFAIDAKVSNAETGVIVGSAYINPNCAAEQFESGEVLAELSYELLKGIGVAESKIAGLKKVSNTQEYKNKIETDKGDAFVEAFISYKKKAEAGDVIAQNNLGYCYYNGQGVKQDYAQAVYWFKKASTTGSKGSSHAQHNLGLCYYNGQGVKQDYAQAFFFFKKAAEAKLIQAQTCLGVCYYEGNGVKKDYEQAVYWFRIAADSGEPIGQFRLGLCYEFGNGVKENNKQAVYWYKKAAEAGNAEAQFCLGVCYANGTGIEKNDEQAFFWIKKSAEAGNSIAQTELGKFYKSGRGVAKDYAQEFYWFKKAAEAGNAEAQFNLGLCYTDGKGVGQNEEQAVYWYKKSAESGNANAQYLLGVCYANGEGVKQDINQAVYWLKKSAEQGNANAQYNLGLLYANGNGLKQDYTQAVYWWKKAAESGNASAQYFLGLCYARADGVEQSFEQAVYWWKKAAEAGIGNAQYFLGAFYEVGTGVKQDYDLAVYWYTKAAEQGNNDATEALKKLAEKKQKNPSDIKRTFSAKQILAERTDGSDSFYIHSTEITQAEYELVMGTNPSNVKGGNLPVTNVSWKDAALFCNALSDIFGLERVYTIDEKNISWNRKKNGFRLPTTGEWYFAANGGKNNDGYTFSGGGNPDLVGWYKDNSNNTIHPVAQKRPNSIGLYDMSGNVMEWCDAIQEGYPYAGGCYSSEKEFTRISLYWDGNNLSWDDNFTNMGFRVIRNATTNGNRNTNKQPNVSSTPTNTPKLKISNASYKNFNWVDGTKYFEISGGRLTGVKKDAQGYLIIPPSVNTICSEAFKQLKGSKLNKRLYESGAIKGIYIPATVKTIEKNAFYLSNIEVIVLGEGITEIGEKAFSEAWETKKIVLPSTLKTIRESALSGLRAIEEIEIPNSVTTIGSFAFQSCKKLKKIIIPANVKKIEHGAFGHCSELEEIIFMGNQVESIGMGCFSCCYSLREIRIPKSVKSITKYDFDNCKNLKTVYLPSHLKGIMFTGTNAQIEYY